jgi:hypothetical protein
LTEQPSPAGRPGRLWPGKRVRPDAFDLLPDPGGF